MTVFDARACRLGEGALWHPLRQQLFWCDILGQKLLSRTGNDALEWRFEAPVSAAGWTDHDGLLVATATGLWQFNIKTGAQHLVIELESDDPSTRSNDGRADPWGGFWIGTMGLAAEPKAGAIYRYFRGNLTKLFEGLTIPNAISFSPKRRLACFTDTATRQVMRVPLDAEGWPAAEPEVFLDLSAENLNPDGAVFDTEDRLWIAMWGAGCVQAYAPDGKMAARLPVAATQPTCPAFGGADLGTLFVTSAQDGLAPQDAPAPRLDGQTLMLAPQAKGIPEPQVIL